MRYKIILAVVIDRVPRYKSTMLVVIAMAILLYVSVCSLPGCSPVHMLLKRDYFLVVSTGDVTLAVQMLDQSSSLPL
jgi:hypothetical protein